MASNRFDICAPRAKKDGGIFWVKLGTAWQNDKGIQLVFDALPIPDADGRCVANLFEPKPRNDAPPARQSQPPRQSSSGWGSSDDLADSIPF